MLTIVEVRSYLLEAIVAFLLRSMFLHRWFSCGCGGSIVVDLYTLGFFLLLTG